jgi:hypothetical protein
MIAVEVLLCHWDGYGMNRNNYRVFSDKETGRMVFMPHGLDQLFGIGGMGSPHTAVFPQMNGMVARTLVGTSEGRSRYRLKLSELRTNLFNVEAITARVREIEARINPVLGELRPAAATRHKNYVNSLCRNIATRAENLDDQLGSAGGEVKFDNKGIARIEGWRPRDPARGGGFDTIKGADGSSLLFLQGDPGRSSVSWRARAVLPKGQYRFQGRVRTKPGPDGSPVAATLRISGARQVALVQAEANWTQGSYDFVVQEPIADIELICEVRGTGSAWFDAGSLQLIRLR